MKGNLLLCVSVQGLKLLSVMSALQVEFTMLKGLFSSENGTSRCQLVTIATEFFLNSGSIEGALNMLRGNGNHGPTLVSLGSPDRSLD